MESPSAWPFHWMKGTQQRDAPSPASEKGGKRWKEPLLFAGLGEGATQEVALEVVLWALEGVTS